MEGGNWCRILSEPKGMQAKDCNGLAAVVVRAIGDQRPQQLACENFCKVNQTTLQNLGKHVHVLKRGVVQEYSLDCERYRIS